MYSKTITGADEFRAESLVSTYWLAFTAMRAAGVGCRGCLLRSWPW